MLDKKYSNSRLAKSEKCEFTHVNDHFEDKHNAEVGLFLQALNNKPASSPSYQQNKQLNYNKINNRHDVCVNNKNIDTTTNYLHLNKIEGWHKNIF